MMFGSQNAVAKKVVPPIVLSRSYFEDQDAKAIDSLTQLTLGTR